MNIKVRIWSLPSIAAVIFGLGIGLSGYAATHALQSIRATRDVDFPMLDGLGSLQHELRDIEETFDNAVAENDRKALESVSARGEKFRSRLRELAFIRGSAPIASRVGDEFNSYLSAANNSARMMMGIDKGNVQASIPKMQSAYKTLSADLEQTHTAAQEEFSGGVINSEEDIRFVIFESVGLAVLVLSALALVSHLVVRAIWTELGGEPSYARKLAQSIAAGDLSPIEGASAASYVSVLASMNEMQSGLVRLIGQVRTTAHGIAIGSTEIAIGNEDLSSRTEQQAASLQQTAASMEELMSTVRQNAENAQQASALASSASDVARNGSAAVDQVVETMTDINQGSSRVAEIIGMIESIAFQTNILALNAAVEAAVPVSKAGDSL